MPGLVFGKYEKIRRLAEGGIGEVWLARQVASVKGFDRLVILKALKPDLAEEAGFVEQFLDEARVAATLNHPGIVALYEVGEWGGTYYIAMEYIAGDDLSRLWYAAAKRGVGLPFQVSVKIVHDAALALDHAHHAVDVHARPLNIVHRDVSPQNVMVRADGVTKLVDFGIAKAANRVSITKTGTVKGKLQYMSPEQVRGEPVDARSDQFSLGIVLWEMCTGKRLFKGDTELATLNKILQLPIPMPSSIVPGFPSELEDVIQRMLERDRRRRYSRCADVARDLRAYLDRASHANGEVSVADFVEDILGDELRARTADLTPEGTRDHEALDDERAELGGRTEERPPRLPTLSSDEPGAMASLLREPTTQSGEDDDAGPATMPVPALREDELEAYEEEHARRRTLERAARPAEELTDNGYEPGSPPLPTLPVPALDEDDGFSRPKRGGARFVLAGMVVVLLLAAGGVLIVDEATRERVLAAFAATSTDAGFDDATLFALLRADQPDDVAAALARLMARYEQATGRERARAAAYASMLASARVRQETIGTWERSLAPPSSDKPAAAATGDHTQALRVQAYKLASEARTLAGNLPEAYLAMASYQAARGATVEAEADLAALEAALADSGRSDEEKRRLLDEAAAQRALASVSAALADEAPGEARITPPAGDARQVRAARVLAMLTKPPSSSSEAAPEREAQPVEREAPAAAGEAGAPDDLVAAAKRAQEAGKSYEAASLFRKAAKRDTGSVDAWLGLGWAYLDLGKHEAAVRAFRRALSLPNAPPEAQLGVAEAYRFSGQKAQAVKAYERYLKQAPAGPDAEVAKNALATLQE